MKWHQNSVFKLAIATLLGAGVCLYAFRTQPTQNIKSYKKSKPQQVDGHKDGRSTHGDRVGQQQPLSVHPDRAMRHNGTQKPMPLSGEVERVVKLVGARSIDSPSREVVRKAVMVTAGDSAHFEEMRDAIASHQKQNPGRTIVFYDLGLSAEQTKEIKTWCGVEYRMFNFSLYPPHTRNLRSYAFKVFVILDILKDNDAVIWIDASIRFHCKEAIEMFALTAGASGVAFPRNSFPSIYCYTHPGIYDYIASNLTLVQTTPLSGAAIFALINTKEMFENIIEWWVRCAFTKGCIAAGAVVGCPKPNNHFTHWVGCHRFDMSAVSLLLLHH